MSLHLLPALLDEAVADGRLETWHLRPRCFTLRASDGTTRDLDERDTRDFLASGLSLDGYLYATH